jgi:hypothetical protein
VNYTISAAPRSDKLSRPKPAFDVPRAVDSFNQPKPSTVDHRSLKSDPITQSELGGQKEMKRNRGRVIGRPRVQPAIFRPVETSISDRVEFDAESNTRPHVASKFAHGLKQSLGFTADGSTPTTNFWEHPLPGYPPDLSTLWDTLTSAPIDSARGTVYGLQPAARIGCLLVPHTRYLMPSPWDDYWTHR